MNTNILPPGTVGPDAGTDDTEAGTRADTAPRRPTKPVRRRSWLANTVIVLALIGTIVPLLYLLSLSLMGRGETVAGILFTTDPKWENWAYVATESDMPRAVLNSIIAALGGTVLTLALSLPGAWAIVQYRTGGRSLASLVTAPWLLPPVVALIPLFMLLRWLQLNDTLLGLTLIYALVNVPVGVWLLEGFLRKLPTEVFEAAALDGAKPWRMLVSVVAPMMTAALVAVGTIIAILNYNEFLLATFITQSPESQTAPVALSLFYGDRTPHNGRIAAASIMVVIPVFAIASILQRKLVAGLASGVGK